MFLILIAVMFFIGGICLYNKGKKIMNNRDSNGEIAKGFGIAIFAIGAIIAFSSMVITFGYISVQKSDFERIIAIEKIEEIYEEKSDVLSQRFATYLLTNYQEYEAGIFQNIKPEDIKIYMVKYPELRTSETILALVEKINQLETDKYNQQIRKENILANVRFRTKNPWIFSSWVPKIKEQK